MPMRQSSIFAGNPGSIVSYVRLEFLFIACGAAFTHILIL